MSQIPRITALINTYDYGRFVGEAIASVLAQDMPPGEMEVLVVDDGSTDDTAAQVARFGGRVRYIRKENGGQASALNVGFAEARGEIIATLDADDLWLPGKVRRVLEEFEKHPEAGMVYHPNQDWIPEQRLLIKNESFHAISGYVPGRLSDVLQYGCLSTSGITVRRTAAERLFPIPSELRIYADTFLVCLMIFVAPVVAVPEQLTCYRRHSDNFTNFEQADAERLRRRWLHYQSAVNEVRRWLERNGYDVRQPNTAAYLERHELAAKMFRFQAEGASRSEFVAHLRRETRLFEPLWSRRYCFYRRLLELAAGALGYDLFCRLQGGYRRADLLRASRRWLFPHVAEATAPDVSNPQQRR